MRKKRKRLLFDIIRILVLLIAFSVLLYPTISNYLYEKNSSRAVDNYDDTSEKLDEARRQAILQEAREYNARLVGGTGIAGDTFHTKEETTSEYDQLLRMDVSGMMGYIIIPKIEVELPIYHTTSEAVLQSGIGHFPSSSLPVGGESTHSVLTGHRGLPSKILFTDLDKLVEGDVFYIKILGETFAYQVDQILTVLPEDTKALSIEPGKDYLTLVTCTPYAVNTHRLLVRGTRIPYEEAVKQAADEKITPELPFQVKMLIVAVVILILIFIIYLIWKKVRKRKTGDH
ncbi:class C sortase [Blautia sp.]|uniref:Sortase family protein n=1 Tax=Blautia glucerasea TaxID=536633 RepID=A0A6N2V3U6_9FIRM